MLEDLLTGKRSVDDASQEDLAALRTMLAQLDGAKRVIFRQLIRGPGDDIDALFAATHESPSHEEQHELPPRPSGMSTVIVQHGSTKGVKSAAALSRKHKHSGKKKKKPPPPPPPVASTENIINAEPLQQSGSQLQQSSSMQDMQVQNATGQGVETRFGESMQMQVVVKHSTRHALAKCKYCHMEGHEVSECSHLLDYTCPICQLKGHSVRYCPRRHLQCRFCRHQGHTVDECPRAAAKAHTYCGNCGANNHATAQCQHQIPEDVVCQICGQQGHRPINCPLELPDEDTQSEHKWHGSTMSQAGVWHQDEHYQQSTANANWSDNETYAANRQLQLDVEPHQKLEISVTSQKRTPVESTTVPVIADNDDAWFTQQMSAPSVKSPRHQSDLLSILLNDKIVKPQVTTESQPVGISVQNDINGGSGTDGIGTVKSGDFDANPASCKSSGTSRSSWPAAAATTSVETAVLLTEDTVEQQPDMAEVLLGEYAQPDQQDGPLQFELEWPADIPPPISMPLVAEPETAQQVDEVVVDALSAEVRVLTLSATVKTDAASDKNMKVDTFQFKKKSTVISGDGMLSLLTNDCNVFVKLGTDHKVSVQLFSLVLHESFADVMSWNATISGNSDCVQKAMNELRAMLPGNQEPELTLTPTVPDPAAIVLPEPLVSINTQQDVKHLQFHCPPARQVTESVQLHHEDVQWEPAEDGWDEEEQQGWGETDENTRRQSWNDDPPQRTIICQDRNILPSNRVVTGYASRKSAHTLRRPPGIDILPSLRSFPTNKSERSIGFCQSWNQGQCYYQGCRYIHRCGKCNQSHPQQQCQVHRNDIRPCYDFNTKPIDPNTDHQGGCSVTANQCTMVHICAYCLSFTHTLVQCGIAKRNNGNLSTLLRVLQQRGYIERKSDVRGGHIDVTQALLAPPVTATQQIMQIDNVQPNFPHVTQFSVETFYMDHVQYKEACRQLLCMKFNRDQGCKNIGCRAHICDFPLIYKRLAKQQSPNSLPLTKALLQHMENQSQANRQQHSYEYSVAICMGSHDSAAHGSLSICSEWNNNGHCPRQSRDSLENVSSVTSQEWTLVGDAYLPCKYLHVCAICKSPAHSAVRCSLSLHTMRHGVLEDMNSFYATLPEAFVGSAVATPSDVPRHEFCVNYNSQHGCQYSDWHCNNAHICSKCCAVGHPAALCLAGRRHSLQTRSECVVDYRTLTPDTRYQSPIPSRSHVHHQMLPPQLERLQTTRADRGA